ncbi:MAG: UvrD-helicase domain-containing protein [Acholeplasmataceae bacterium]|nr:UvrD-helicase domain-containing protein [Acholeplasmataceae bacterium]
MHFLSALNPSQLKAVIHPGGPVFVVAGAGTGKTKTLTTRIAYLILEGEDPSSILAVTFTNKAAREMKARVIDMAGERAANVWLYTFHAFGLQILRRHIAELPYGYRPNFSVIDEDDGKKIIQDVVKTLGYDPKKFSTRQLKSLISLYKCYRMETFERNEEEKIFQAYQRHLRENQLLDFDDLLIYVLELLENHKEIRTYYQRVFNHVLVDEFQDTDAIQYKIMKILGLAHRNVFVVGDPDQSIYGFRGANYQNNTRFIDDFGAETIILEHNYRSTNLILEAANRLIGHNINRPTEKNLESSLGAGYPVTYHHAQSDYRETYFITNEIERLRSQGYDYEDMVILYRNNALSRLIEDALMKEGIPYIIYGGISFYERREVKDVLAYVRCVLDPHRDFYLKRIINVPKRALGQVSVQRIEDTARKNGISLYDAIDMTDLSAGATKNIRDFKALIESMRADFDAMIDLTQVIPYVIKKTGYLDMLRNSADEISDDRIENLKELQTVFTRGDMYYEGSFLEKMTALLDQIALYTDLDKETHNKDVVKLSTIHQVKGLEFKVVFMIVMEEGIFPGERALNTSSELEEDRRVAYVGMTRAKERLYLSYSDQRMVYGSMRFAYPSRFLNESRIRAEEPTSIKSAPVMTNLLKTGDHVTHNTFGLGVVISVDGEIATIAFNFEHGIKKILESHPGLKKVKKETSNQA